MGGSANAGRRTAVVVVALVSLASCKTSTNSDVKNAPDSTGVAAVSHGAATKAATKKPSVAHLGQSITVKGNEDGSKMAVTAVRLRLTVHATDGFSTPDPGKKYVAVQFRLRNAGTAAYDDSPSNGAKIIDSQGQQFDADFGTDINVGAMLPSSVKLAPGSSALGYILFQVPRASRVAKVQFSMDSGFAQTAEWAF